MRRHNPMYHNRNAHEMNVKPTNPPRLADKPVQPPFTIGQAFEAVWRNGGKSLQTDTEQIALRPGSHPTLGAEGEWEQLRQAQRSGRERRGRYAEEGWVGF